MKVFEYLERINRMHKLIMHCKTGTPGEFAGKLGLSRTSLYEMIDELRSRGAPISYSKSMKTFFYNQPYDISITCSFRPLTSREKVDNGGGTISFSRVLFFRTLRSDLSTVTLPC
jgi:hypothetical protein